MKIIKQQINKYYIWKKITSNIKEYIKFCYKYQGRGRLKKNNHK